MRAVEKFRAYRGVAPRANRNHLDLFRRIVRRPGVSIGVGAYEFGLLISNRLDNRTKALAALKVSSLVGCEFCLDLGSAFGREFGITDNDLRGLAVYGSCASFSGREKLAIEFAEAMTSTPSQVTDELRSRVCREFTETELVELAAEIAWENHRARLNRALGVRPMGFSDGTLCLRPEATVWAEAH